MKYYRDDDIADRIGALKPLKKTARKFKTVKPGKSASSRTVSDVNNPVKALRQLLKDTAPE